VKFTAMRNRIDALTEQLRPRASRVLITGGLPAEGEAPPQGSPQGAFKRKRASVEPS
jgi:hypothetical protein